MMKSCKGCKHLVAFGNACKANERYVRTIDTLTGNVKWREVNYGRILRPSPQEARSLSGKCKPERLLFEPRLLARLFPWLFGVDP